MPSSARPLRFACDMSGESVGNHVRYWHVRDVTPAATRAAAIKGATDLPARSPFMLRPRCRTLKALSCSDPIYGTIPSIHRRLYFTLLFCYFIPTAKASPPHSRHMTTLSCPNHVGIRRRSGYNRWEPGNVG